MGREREYPLWLWWMSPKERRNIARSRAERTQKTHPKGTDEHGHYAEPMEIPVPKREDVEEALDRLIAAQPDEDLARKLVNTPKPKGD